MKRFTLVLLTILVILLSACAPSAQQIATPVAATVAAWPTQTAFPTYTALPPLPSLTPLPTYTAVPTLTPQVIIVTPTFTATPQFTPTITNTPAPTKDAKETDKDPGIYLINVDIAPGVWRNNGNGTECYWKVTTREGGIIQNFFGQAGGTAYIPATGFQIQFDTGCGVWTYLGK